VNPLLLQEALTLSEAYQKTRLGAGLKGGEKAPATGEELLDATKGTKEGRIRRRHLGLKRRMKISCVVAGGGNIQFSKYKEQSKTRRRMTGRPIDIKSGLRQYDLYDGNHEIGATSQV